MILAIETSCDDTCAAVVEPDGRRALSNVVHTQMEHARYGGVVPEVASRAHLERLDGVVQKSLFDAGVSLDDVSRVAVTTRPGLIGALLVGGAAAKGLAYARGLPLVPVNHLEGHVAAAYLSEPELEPPFVALIASGGHTALYYVDRDRKMRLLGETLDDAAGEALDKGARMLGLGFPGGRPGNRGLASWHPCPVPRRRRRRASLRAGASCGPGPRSRGPYARLRRSGRRTAAPGRVLRGTRRRRGLPGGLRGPEEVCERRPVLSRPQPRRG